MPRQDQPIRRGSNTCGFTIVELLVASSIALVVMGAITSLFAIFGRSVSDSQAVVEMNNQMRLAANRLRMDLEGATAPLRPPLSAETGDGYFELVEGPQTDLTFSGTSATSGTSGPNRILGDTDDRLVFTTRTTGTPFSGKFDGSRLESNVAEVAWFCKTSAYQPIADLELQTLYCRKALVAGYVGQAPFQGSGNTLSATSPVVAQNTYDLSLRRDPNTAGILIPNTLIDVMHRQNRLLHGDFDDLFPADGIQLYFDATSGREGEDVVLNNVIGFDIRVFDPEAAARTNSSATLFPGDPEYYAKANPLGTLRGAFVDLGQPGEPDPADPPPPPPQPRAWTTGTTPTPFSLQPAAQSQLVFPPGSPNNIGLSATYDTWTTAYEYNGINEDGDVDSSGNPIVDEGADGIDNDGDTLVDEADEAETAPPYAEPLKAIEIRIRCYEPTSKQIRQITIRHAFTQ